MKTRIFAAVFAACTFAAMQAQADTAPAASPAAIKSELAYTSYSVLDQKRALDFYVGLLGMTERQRITPSPGVTEIVLGFDKERTPGILLMHRADRTKPYEIGDGFSRTIIHVSDVKAMVQKLTDAKSRSCGRRQK